MKKTLREKVIHCMQRYTMEANEYHERLPFRSPEGYHIEQIHFQKSIVVINYDEMSKKVIELCRRDFAKRA